jgi:hypothetical protein
MEQSEYYGELCREVLILWIKEAAPQEFVKRTPISPLLLEGRK